MYNTEREIARCIDVSDEDFKKDPVAAGADFVDEHEQNDQLVDEMSDVEGWDGRKLPLAEIAERNLTGDRQDGWDRPLEIADMEDAAEKMDVLQSQNAEQGRVIDSLLTGGAPSDIDRAWNATIAQEHQRLENTGMVDPAERNAAILGKIHHMHEVAEARHGNEFSERFNALVQDAGRSPTHLQYLKGIILDRNLGPGVMRYGPPRQQQQSERRQQQPRQQQTDRHQEMALEDQYGGWGNQDVERDIMYSAFKD